jgi:aminoglycoside phosphotransferase (APT) family kinase protein
MTEPLRQSEVVAYLLQRDLIGARDVCDADVLVADASRRNYNVRVERRGGASYLVKQCAEPNAVETLANEAKIYSLIHTDPRYRSLAKWLPRCYGYDATKNLLVLELLTGDAQDLEHYHAHGYFSKTIARAVGRALALLHQSSRDVQLTAPPASDLPWVFSLHRPSLAQWRDLSAASSQVVGILQRHLEFGDLIDRCAGSWQPEALIHGDIKWANFVVFSPAGSGRKTRLRIVDWEYAGFGDPGWDVGGVFSAFMGHWVLSMPIGSTGDPSRWARLSRFPLEVMQPAIRAFWEAYARHRGLDSRERENTLWRSTMFAAVRLVQTAIERTQGTTAVSKNIVFLLQLAMNALIGPLETIVHVLGIDLKTDLALRLGESDGRVAHA